MDLGRPVAYYPELKQVTGSTTATILLCQLLYWTPRTKHKDKWIYKTNYEIEEETGLTYNEQKTAKKALKDIGIIDYEVKRLDRTTRYRVMEEQLNLMWESVKEGATQLINPPPVDGEDEEPDEESPEEYFNKEWEKGKEERDKFKENTMTDIRRRKETEKKDLVDSIVDTKNSYGMKKAEKISEITLKIEKKLKINPVGRYWESFIEFVYVREKKGEKIEKFLKWLTEQEDFEVKYWSPQRMITYYPQAFINKDSEENFVTKMPERREKVIAPMPDSVASKKRLS